MIELFDIKEYFRSRNIRFTTSGRNVSEGWVNIQCPFPLCGDPSNHLGISPQLRFNCWKCGEKGFIIRLIQQLEDGCSEAMARTIINRFQTDTIPSTPLPRKLAEATFFPPGTEKELPELHTAYLWGRGFDPEKIQHQYGVRGCLQLGDFAYRLIIPVYINNEFVNFTGRDVTGVGSPKYKNCPNAKAVISMKDCIYNLDTVRDRMLIVEGPLDVWRMGDGTVATMGTEWTTAQLNLIRWKKPKHIFILYDGESTAIEKAHDLGQALSLFFPNVTVLEMETGDPGGLSEEEAAEVRRSVF